MHPAPNTDDGQPNPDYKHEIIAHTPEGKDWVWFTNARLNDPIVFELSAPLPTAETFEVIVKAGAVEAAKALTRSVKNIKPDVQELLEVMSTKAMRFCESVRYADVTSLETVTKLVSLLGTAPHEGLLLVALPAMHRLARGSPANKLDLCRLGALKVVAFVLQAMWAPRVEPQRRSIELERADTTPQRTLPAAPGTSWMDCSFAMIS